MATAPLPPVEEYMALLEAYHKAISQPGWPDSTRPLIVRMDELWHRLTDTGRRACMDHAYRLYRARAEGRPT